MERFKNQSTSSTSFRKTVISNHDVAPTKVKGVLQECYFIISDLKAKNKFLQDQLNLKNSAIDKLIRQKQDHILHLSQCASDELKKKLQSQGKRSEEMRQNFETILDKYERIIKKNQHDLEKLKGFNEVLRVENNLLRNELSQSKVSWRQREQKIGKISQMKASQSLEEGNQFSFTINRSQCLYPHESAIMAKFQAITPQKIITSKSTNLSTAARSSNKPVSRKQPLPRNLFHNTRLNDHITSNRQSERLNSQENEVIDTNRQQTIGIWFNRLRKLLADSEDED